METGSYKNKDMVKTNCENKAKMCVKEGQLEKVNSFGYLVATLFEHD